MTTRLRCHVLIFLSYALLVVLLTFPLILRATKYIPMPTYLFPKPWIHDHWLALWAFWLVKRSLFTSFAFPLYTDDIFFPTGVKMPWATTVSFPMVASLPFQAAFGLILGSNLLLLFSTACAAYAAFLLVRDLVQDRAAAYLAGIVFGFSPFMLAHLQGHDFVVIGSSWIPLYALFLIRTLRNTWWPDALAAAGFFWMTLLSAWYYVPFLGILTAIFLVNHVYDHRGRTLSKSFVTSGFLLVGACLAGSLLIILPMLRDSESRHVLQVSSDSARWASPDLLAFFIPSSDHFLLGEYTRVIRERFTGDPTLQTVFLGYAVLFLAVFALLHAPGRVIRPWLWSTTVFFVLSLGPTLHVGGVDSVRIGGLQLALSLPFALFRYVPSLPYLGGASAIGLFVVMVMLSLAVLCGFGVRELRQRMTPPTARLLSGALVSLIMLESAPIPFPVRKVDVPKVYETIKEDPNPVAILELPFSSDITIYQYYQTVHGKKLVNGSLNRLPVFNQTFGENIPLVRMLKRPQTIPRDGIDSSLAETAGNIVQLFKIGYIVLHRNYFTPEDFRRIDALVKATLPARLIAQEGDVFAYRIESEGMGRRANRGAYRIGFGTEAGPPVLLEGWSTSESRGPSTFAWSNARESTLWLHLAERSNMRMDLRLFPFTFPSAPTQQVKISVNRKFLAEIKLENRWQTYSLAVPREYLQVGVNAIRFMYRYTALPSKVIPGSRDARMLAVAFDEITLRPDYHSCPNCGWERMSRLTDGEVEAGKLRPATTKGAHP